MKTQEADITTLIADALYVRTPLGMARIQGNHTAITSIKLVESIPDHQEAEVTPLNKELLTLAAEELINYFKGTLQEFTFPLEPEGTEFQQRVWRRLREIPFGKSMSYLELSKALGDPKAIRAVAAANGKNPIWIAIPCHRIIGSDGSLVGYAGGLHRKKWLLNHESPNRQVALFDS